MVEFRHVRFGYGAGDQGSAGEEATEALAPAPQHVLKDITFSIKPGETVAIVGQTGSVRHTDAAH